MTKKDLMKMLETIPDDAELIAIERTLDRDGWPTEQWNHLDGVKVKPKGWK